MRLDWSEGEKPKAAQRAVLSLRRREGMPESALSGSVTVRSANIGRTGRITTERIPINQRQAEAWLFIGGDGGVIRPAVRANVSVTKRRI